MSATNYKYSIYPIHSKRDKTGNCYWAFRALNVVNGKVVEANISGSEGNIKLMCLNLTEEYTWEATNKLVLFNNAQEMPIHVFDKYVKSFPYAGSNPKELAGFVIDKIG